MNNNVRAGVEAKVAAQRGAKGRHERGWSRDQGDTSPTGIFCRQIGRVRSPDAMRWGSLLLNLLAAARAKTLVSLLGEPMTIIDQAGEGRVADDWRMAVFELGKHMENITETLHITREELTEAKRDLQTLANELASVADIIEPALVDQTRRIRAARMVALDETRQALNALRELRAFFSDAGYVEEIKRMEHFVTICQQFKRLKDEGLLDAVVDMTKRI